MSLKVQEMKILKTLESVFKVTDVKYDILSKTFFYKKDGEVKDITFAAILRFLEEKDLTEEEKEIYQMLDLLNSSYFPRRLRQLFENIYYHLDIELPKDLYISKDGIHVDDKKGIIIEYQDDWEEIINNYEKAFGVNIKEKMDQIKFEDYKGEYHQK